MQCGHCRGTTELLKAPLARINRHLVLCRRRLASRAPACRHFKPTGTPHLKKKIQDMLGERRHTRQKQRGGITRYVAGSPSHGHVFRCSRTLRRHLTLRMLACAWGCEQQLRRSILEAARAAGRSSSSAVALDIDCDTASDVQTFASGNKSEAGAALSSAARRLAACTSLLSQQVCTR